MPIISYPTDHNFIIDKLDVLNDFAFKLVGPGKYIISENDTYFRIHNLTNKNKIKFTLQDIHDFEINNYIPKAY